MVANTIIFAHSVNYSEYDVDQYAERSLASFSGVEEEEGEEKECLVHTVCVCAYIRRNPMTTMFVCVCTYTGDIINSLR